MDLYELLMAGDADAATMARERAAALRKTGGAGAILAGAGGRRLAPLGGDLMQRQDQGEAALTGAAQTRLVDRRQQAQAAAQKTQADRSYGLDVQRTGMERERLTQDAWGAVADPVTGGIVMFNKKTGEVKPLGPGGGQPAPAGTPSGLPNLPGKPTEKQRNAVSTANENIAKLDMALKALDDNPGAYGGVGNYAAGLADEIGGTPVQALTSRRLKPGELQAKNFVTNVVSGIINDRAGANVTMREELRQKFLPSEMDALKAARQKLLDLKAFDATTYQTQGGGALPAPDTAPPAAGPVRKFTRVNGKLVEVK
jgi:hypothetical protein